MKKFSLNVHLVSVLLLYALTLHNAEAAIVNINSQVNYLGNPVEIFLDAGTYTVTPTGTADGGAYNAWNPWSNTSCADPAGCVRTSPTTVTGWMNRYEVISSDIAAVSVDGVELVPVDAVPSPVTESFFLSTPTEGRYSVTDFMVYPDALTALATAMPSTFTLSTAGMVGFSINDLLPLGDNTGGISLNVSAVPVPAAVWLFGSGLLGLVGVARRNRT
ncbi:MAG: hypothetical protein BMS9Abin06_0883 [Gammaproteobacteria bacterium]|nr:MAG: hypothetical protein BMS9Abin06_0883 [Gammaproteobacteria bacterium]